MKPTAIIGLILVMTLVLLSSYLRLVADVQDPMSWARPMHRLIAGTIGLLVLGLAGLSLQRKQHRGISFVLLGLTVFLAGLGIYSEGSQNPAVVLGNFSGGFAMLGVFGWLVFTKDGEATRSFQNIRTWGAVAITVLCLQILSGGPTSASFAASAGQALNMLHWILALFIVAVVLVTGIQAIRAGQALRSSGVFVCVVVVAELLTGIATEQPNVAIGVAVSHNWLAGLLLLGLLRIRAN